MSLASASLFQHDPHHALELYSKVNTAQACWNSCQVREWRATNDHKSVHMYICSCVLLVLCN